MVRLALLPRARPKNNLHESTVSMSFLKSRYLYKFYRIHNKLIFINDLSDNIKSSVRLFTDDCVLYRNIHSLQDCLILQEDLDSLGLWEADWQMKFNVAKCHSMRVTQHYSHKQIIMTKLCICKLWKTFSPKNILV